MDDYTGVKIALIKGDELLVIQRDNIPNIPYANMWDFAGGAREGGETPFECVAREVNEELGLVIRPEAIVWEKTYSAMHDSAQRAYFMVANIDENDIKNVVFGDEGQGWKLISVEEFMRDDTVIEPLKGRLSDYLSSRTNH